MSNFTETEPAAAAKKNTSAEPPSDEQLLANLDRKMPALRVFLTAANLRQNSPEFLSRVPDDLRTRFQQGDPSVLPDLLRTKPELFRNELLGKLEDEAFSQLLAGQEPSPQQPSETSPEPSSA